jgi:hypothetical protein
LATLDIYGLDNATSQGEYNISIQPLLFGLGTLEKYRPPELISLIQESLTLLQDVHTGRASIAGECYKKWLQSTDPEFRKRMDATLKYYS